MPLQSMPTFERNFIEKPFVLDGDIKSHVAYNKEDGKEEDFLEAATLAIVLHPMAVLGGDMNNYVVVWLQHAMSKHLPTIRYNCPNTSFTAKGEASDTERLIRILSTGKCTLFPKCRRIFVCGYSAGAMAAIRIGTVFKKDPCLAGLALIGPPLGFLGNLFMGGRTETPYSCTCQQLWLCGMDDQYCGPDQFRSRVRQYTGVEAKPPRDNKATIVFSNRSNDICPVLTSSEKYESRISVVLIPNVCHFPNAEEFIPFKNYLQDFMGRCGLVSGWIDERNQPV